MFYDVLMEKKAASQIRTRIMNAFMGLGEDPQKTLKTMREKAPDDYAAVMRGLRARADATDEFIRDPTAATKAQKERIKRLSGDDLTMFKQRQGLAGAEDTADAVKVQKQRFDRRLQNLEEEGFGATGEGGRRASKRLERAVKRQLHKGSDPSERDEIKEIIDNLNAPGQAGRDARRKASERVSGEIDTEELARETRTPNVDTRSVRRIGDQQFLKEPRTHGAQQFSDMMAQERRKRVVEEIKDIEGEVAERVAGGAVENIDDVLEDINKRQGASPERQDALRHVIKNKGINVERASKRTGVEADEIQHGLDNNETRAAIAKRDADAKKAFEERQKKLEAAEKAKAPPAPAPQAPAPAPQAPAPAAQAPAAQAPAPAAPAAQAPAPAAPAAAPVTPEPAPVTSAAPQQAPAPTAPQQQGGGLTPAQMAALGLAVPTAGYLGYRAMRSDDDQQQQQTKAASWRHCPRTEKNKALFVSQFIK